MDKAEKLKRISYVFCLAGLMFFVSAYLTGQTIHIALGAVFICLGAVNYSQYRKRKAGTCESVQE